MNSFLTLELVNNHAKGLASLNLRFRAVAGNFISHDSLVFIYK